MAFVPEFTSVSNPVWNDAAHSAVLVNVTVAQLGDATYPFVASPTDTEAHGREIFEKCVTGAYGKIAPFVAKPPPPAPTVDATVVAAVVAHLAANPDAAAAVMASASSAAPADAAPITTAPVAAASNSDAPIGENTRSINLHPNR